MAGTRLLDLSTQKEALQKLAELTQRATINPLVRNTALKIVRGVDSRDDVGELDAIFNAVKYGDPAVAPLAEGFKYVADPRFADYFASPVDNINQCLKGACGGDCDDHAGLICALAGSIGFGTGLRAYGPPDTDGYSHVYAVALLPKRPTPVYGAHGDVVGFKYKRAVGMDTTVDHSKLGWEPPRGNVLTAWIG